MSRARLGGVRYDGRELGCAGRALVPGGGMRARPIILALALAGCGSGADGRNGPEGTTQPTSLSTDTDTTTLPQTTPSGCVGCTDVAPAPRLARLTHVQWENTVQDLLRLDEPSGLSDSFIGDGLSEGFGNNAEALEVSSELWQDYQRAAEELALLVVSDEDQYAVVVPHDPRDGGGLVGFSERIEGEDPGAVATTGAAGGSDYNLWSNGSLTVSFDVPSDALTTVRARVWADQAGPDLARATLSVDAVDLLTTDVVADSSGTAELLEVEVDLVAGFHTVQVSFLNDYYDPDLGADRNLRIDWFEIEGASRTLGESTAGAAERDAWITDFGQRAFRRPLTADESFAYAELFELGPELVGSGDAFSDGVRVVLEAMLQSPFFLYRVEESTEAQGPRIPLSSYEMASKLSYALWNRMPDDELFELAASDSLTDPAVVAAQAERMLEAPQAVGAIDAFHRELLHTDNYANIYKDADAFPLYQPEMNEWMATEAELFTREVVRSGEGIHTLYSAPWTMINDGLAPVYGVPGPGPDFTRVDLDPSQRAGLLTQSGFLAVHSDPLQPGSIHRGVFVDLQLLCMNLPPPPDDVTPLPPVDVGTTNRERVDAHTGPGTCGEACHAGFINPVGFAFEGYDAMGMYRTTDNGFPVDASGSFFFTEGEASWVDAVGFAAVMADSDQAHRCYVQNWLEFLHGRAADDADIGLLDFLGTRSRSEDRAIRSLIVDVVTSDGFRNRSDEGGN